MLDRVDERTANEYLDKIRSIAYKNKEYGFWTLRFIKDLNPQKLSPRVKSNIIHLVDEIYNKIISSFNAEGTDVYGELIKESREYFRKYWEDTNEKS